MKQFTATANDEGVRLSRFVQSVTRDLPTSLLYKSFRNKRVKVNGKKGAPEDRLKAGDLIELYINDEFFPPEGAKPAARKPAPKKQQNQPRVTVIYEDENIAVLYKPTHLLCHSDRTGDANLVDAFTQYLAQKGEYDPQGENRFKPGICNRLDRGTEGLVIAAKSYAALRDMNEIIRTDLLKKEYYTITVGIPQSGRFTAWWEHDEKNNKVSIHAHQAQDVSVDGGLPVGDIAEGGGAGRPDGHNCQRGGQGRGQQPRNQSFQFHVISPFHPPPGRGLS